MRKINFVNMKHALQLMDIVTNIFIEKTQLASYSLRTFLPLLRDVVSAIIEKTLFIHELQTSFTMVLKTVWSVTDTPAGNNFMAIIRSEKC